MNTEGSVTRWIHGIKSGDEVAAQQLWQRYFERLLRLCRKRLPDNARRVADEEDVVLGVMASFYRRAQQGQFPHLNDRHDLWRLLVVMTARRAANLVRDQNALKRAAHDVVGESALDIGSDERMIEQVVGYEPSPDFAASVVEEYERRMAQLDEPMRLVALRKLEGYTNAEIAQELKTCVRTVERKLWVIRTKWSQDLTLPG
jgi:DNA-directed RNA polymerase specialized sigma24 family protein